VPAVSFERVMCEVRARYVTGLTATPQRRDGHHPILAMQLGPVRFTASSRSRIEAGSLRQELVVRETSFRLATTVELGIQEIYAALAADAARNELILDDVIRAVADGRSPILLTERRDHLDLFAERLRGFVRHLVVLHGGASSRKRRELAAALAAIPDDEERLVLATGRYIGEGFDDARLDTLFLALPVSWKGTLVQYAGRLNRRHEGKRRVIVFDYVDRDVPVLRRMFEKRLRGYRAMGYRARNREVAGDNVPAERTIEYNDEALGRFDRE
jgi:superfamily II DNA or RNA helicase